MAAEPLAIFDPRRNVQTQGFAGRAATTTLHDATATGVSISGIFQAADDFAVPGFYNARTITSNTCARSTCRGRTSPA